MARGCLRWYLAVATGCVLAAHTDKESFAQYPEPRAKETSAQDAQASKDEAEMSQLRAAWELKRKPITICNLGRVELEMGKARDAAESLSTCLRVLPQDERAIIGGTVERELKKARAQVGALSVEANVPGAQIVVDGKVAGTIPLNDPMFLDPGRYGVEVRAPGYEPEAKIAQLGAGSWLLMRMVLEPAEIEVAPGPKEQPAPASAPKTVEKAPVPALSPAPAGVARRPLDAPPAPRREAEGEKKPVNTALLIAGFSLGIVGTAAGAIGFVAAAGARKDAEAGWQSVYDAWYDEPCVMPEYRVNCDELKSTGANASTFTAVGVGGVLMATAGGALFVYELVRSSSQNEVGDVRTAIVAAPGGGALIITGSF